MALETYRAKRDFKITSEPSGAKGKTKGNSFVIQKHAATRLHYDLRLEMDGVLKSWAVTKGPSLITGEKRLAVHVEDHPLDYADFEGTIPKGQYGAGSVIVWDKGIWTPRFDPKKGYAKGHLEFDLQGEKLQGHWHLVRMKGKPNETPENWLLIKGEDDHARPESAPDILTERPESVKSGQTLDDLAKGSKPSRRKPKAASEGPKPGFIPPALAELAPSPPRVRDGCTRSSSTAIAFRRMSKTARSRFTPATATTGPPNSAAILPRPSAPCPAQPPSSTASLWSRMTPAPPTFPPCRATLARGGRTASCSTPSTFCISTANPCRTARCSTANRPSPSC